MPLRFLEVRLPLGVHEEVEGLAEGHALIDQWCVPSGDREVHRFLLDSGDVEGLVDAIRSRFGEDVRVVILPVEATLPRPAEEAPAEVTPEEAPPVKGPPRVSREELYEDIGERIRLTPVFMALALLSAAVAAIGLVQDDLVAIIGAMIIAPLLGPNMALALATTMADFSLARKALRAGLVGMGAALLLSILLGVWLPVDPDALQITTRTHPGAYDLAIALISGVAGALAFTSALPASLLGVVVALALVPPLAAGGLLLGAGYWKDSVGAFLLLGVNLIAVNLSAVGTFVIQGVHPEWWWKAKQARRTSLAAMAVWCLLLLLLVAAMAYARGWVP